MNGPGDPCRICLWGMPGVGKSTVGAALAQKLEMDFCDLDSEVQRRTGLTVAELIGLHGEAYFRKQEALSLEEFCLEGSGIMALGGGSLVEKRLRQEVREHCLVITLLTGIDILESRLDDTELAKRPLLDSQVPLKVQLATLFESRASQYRDVDLVVDVNARNVGDVVNLIGEHISRGLAA